jgi:hypothetical protein
MIIVLDYEERPCDSFGDEGLRASGEKQRQARETSGCPPSVRFHMQPKTAGLRTCLMMARASHLS